METVGDDNNKQNGGLSHEEGQADLTLTQSNTIKFENDETDAPNQDKIQ